MRRIPVNGSPPFWQARETSEPQDSREADVSENILVEVADNVLVHGSPVAC